ncbi:HET-domain-containing protein [Mollisia scopiformis]|uniref:HET-domain-containing protein n=1 Tax=Mollisia scopiformis TaxID=149040 RepID=A0A194WYX1_MOLSC|nr:HET-domain-containing protein [Mollisia scopiformis]KUJ13158.1 HET-domain-containing protein [Mollisia scopiformis]
MVKVKSLFKLRGFRKPSKSEFPKLCKTCRNIDFKKYLIYDDETSVEATKAAIKLGYLDDLIQRSSSCPLCALIVDCAKRRNDGEQPPVVYKKKRVKVSTCRKFICRVYGEGDQSAIVQRMVLEFEPAIFGYFSHIRFQLSTPNEEVSGFGRQMKPIIDMARLKGWLSDCEVRHGNQCHAPSWLGEQKQPRFLRVIDTEKKCVVHAPSECRYVALSYVWGNRKKMQSRLWLSTKATKDKLEREGGLDVKSLPKTIFDALHLLSEMGERYLWADALCIVQDDDTELAEQTSQMDLVYARAVFTIIVASGTNANAGLPGLHANTRSALQGSIRIDDKYSLTQTVAQGNATHLAQSTWNSRGWTFQERLLSRRVLIFTPEQVFWNCESAVCCEETTLERFEDISVLPQALDCHDEWEDKPDKFSRDSLRTYIIQYSGRDFTYQSDALAAFSGILRRMEYENKESYHWGLPHTRFDQALSWDGGAKLRDALCRLTAEDGSVHQVPFPTWSWLGWTGFISGPMYNETVHAHTLNGTSKSELQFYKVGLHNDIQLIQGPDPDSTPPTRRYPKNDEQKYFPLRSRWKGETSIENISPGLLAQPFIDTGRLTFWTSHARIMTRYDETSHEISIVIKGKKINVPTSGSLFQRHFETRRRAKIISIMQTSQKRPLDFIVVGRFAEIERLEMEKLNVLIVEWDEDEKERNVARMTGTAVIEEKDWVEAEREWKLVILK